MNDSLPTDYFDELYRQNTDPWDFETSSYERDKYAATLAALPRERYQSVFEIGCSIGVLTQQLATRCERLLAVDGSEMPLQQARPRLQNQPHVQLAQMRVPDTFPDDTFDLILVSEVGYYWSWDDLAKAQQHMLRALRPGGHLLLVHWVRPTNYPLTGDEVHDAFCTLDASLQHQQHQRTDRYRLDRWERRVESAAPTDGDPQ